jgi:hypothetical protein
MVRVKGLFSVDSGPPVVSEWVTTPDNKKAS